MTAAASARIFVSYATKDGAEAAASLRRDLEAEGFAIWQDIVALQGNADWWTQIEATLRAKQLEHVVLLVTPGALASHVVRNEIRLARQEGKSIWPVKGPGIDVLSKLPRWLGNLYDLDIAERRTNLLRVLELPSAARRVPMMAPEPPADFVERPSEFGELKKQLLDAKGDAVAITAALRGAGGYGKTTLAKALANDPDVQDAYYDGILWVELGEQGGGRLTTLINDLVALITGKSPQVTTVEAARAVLGDALGDRRFLLIIDDVWQKRHLEPFLHGGKNSTRLVTTRFDRELPETAVRQIVDAMQTDQAAKLLTWGLPSEQAIPLQVRISALAVTLHEWAQLLKLANGFLRDRVVKFKQPLAKALAEAEQRLIAKGLPAFDDAKAKGIEGRHKSVAAAIGVNLDLLDADKRARFAELGIFPEDVDIPVGIVARLWAGDAEPDEFATLDLLAELYDLSLLLTLDLDRRMVRFHDTTRRYLRDEANRKGQLAAQHNRLIAAMGDMGGAVAAPAPDTDYFYRYLTSHLADAGERTTLDQLLLDPGWLTAKLAVTSNPQLLVADYEQHGRGQIQNLIGRTLRLTIGICARDERQLLPQILSRLMANIDSAAPAFLSSVRRLIKPPALITQRLSLTPPGGEIARLEGHTESVSALALLPDGRLASASADQTIRLWDPKSGTETARLEGHTDGIWGLVLLPDGRLVSGSEDETIRLWDLKTETETARFQGHANAAWALALLPDGRLASGSRDKTIRLWDAKTGAETALLDGHTGWVTALAVLPDGQLASGSADKTIRLWSLITGAETARFQGHTGSIWALALLPDGRLASGSADKTIRLWDLNAGAETARLDGHTGWVTALALMPDGRLVSGSYDKSIRLWDTQTSTQTTRLEGATDMVTALALLPDGRLASGSHDKSIRLWDPKTRAEAAGFEGHAGWVTALTLLSDGRLASGSDDNTIRLWDPTTGAEAARFVGDRDAVWALAILPDGRLASGSEDKAIRLWDPKNGTETARLEGHTDRVCGLVLLPDGRLASSSHDKTIRLWDPRNCAETARLEGHTDRVWALALLPDGRLASCSHDKTIRLWDPKTGAETARFEGHTDWVWALALLPDGRLASGSHDKTIRLWDTVIGAETARLQGHTGAVATLALLPDGRLASGSHDKTIRLWDTNTAKEIVRLEVDAGVLCLAALPDGRLVAGDEIGRLHWLETLD